MPDYKEMYLKMARASEQAIRILIKAQRECEELYLSGPELTVLGGREEASEGRAAQAQDVESSRFNDAPTQRQRKQGEARRKHHAPEGS